MFGDGNTFYHPVYVDNLVDAFELAAAKEMTQGETYLIGDDHYYSLNELVQHVAAALNLSVRIRHLPFWPLWCTAWTCEMLCKPFRISPPLFRRRVDWFRQNRAFDITKAKQGLAYQPKVDLETGLARTARWYLDNHLL